MNPNASSRPAPAVDPVAAMRSFSRFYTQRIGVLNRYLGSDLSLAEMRLLYELANTQQPTATELARALSLDAGFLSRLLRRFETRGWVKRRPHPDDGRQSLLALTPAGRKVYEPLAVRTDSHTAALLAEVPATEQANLIDAMATMQRLMAAPGSQRQPRREVRLREPQAGDMGWMIEQHGAIYRREWGYGAPFEALAAEICAKFLRTRDPARERGWIAEVDGQRVGCVLLLRKSTTVAQLRMLLLAPGARGLGLGRRLVDECIAFARAQGYRKLMLWTMEHLQAARGIYEDRGFRRIRSEPDDSFGTRVTAEVWELKL
jgi:DNA-binding MarR family transcriptional regulator/GNAT superfamily N-acetyltransferase